MSSIPHTPALQTNNISLADEEEVKRVLVDSVLGLWDVVNNLTRLRPSRRELREPVGERVRGELQREAAQRVAEPGIVFGLGGGAVGDRSLATRSQSSPTAQRVGLSNTRGVRGRLCSSGLRWDI